jgi:hypothetical protein
LVEHLQGYFSWLASASPALSPIWPNSHFACYHWLNSFQANEQQFLLAISSISESNKLKALKAIQTMLSTVPQAVNEEFTSWEQTTFDLPHPIHRIVLPLVEYFILHPTEPTKHNQPKNKSNLASTFNLLALDILPLITGQLKESMIKKALKRLVSKLKLSEMQNKRNIALIRMISQLVEGLPGEKATQKLAAFI